MHLISLAVRDWRNLPAARLETDSRFVVLHGDNGQGKTNLLEAVVLLATLRSFREPRPRRWIRHGQDSAEVRGEVRGSTGLRRLAWSWQDGRRALEVDGAPPVSLGDWFAVVRAVMFAPTDAVIVRGEPEWRRRFLDRAEFTARPDYLDLAREYARVVAQKGALLRTGRARPAELDVWDRQIAALGGRLAARRSRIVSELAVPFATMHAAIAGSGAEVRLVLRGVCAGAGTAEAASRRLAEAIARARPDELQRGRVLVGPHRDDLDILIEGHLARTFASQGQARTVVLALKLAELLAARDRGEAPLFLLDDLTSELDARRMGRLVDVLGGLESQVWITTTDPAHLGPIPETETARWRVRSGDVSSG